MSRHFPDFLNAYFDYAKDNFSCDAFHRWTGLSVLAGALERRVWVDQAGRKTFPNLYVFLVSNPGEGKSSAGDLGTMRLLRKVKRDAASANFLPDQLTEAAFIDSMKNTSSFLLKVNDEQGWRIEQQHQCAHYLYASEASNTLKELAGGGEITAALTEFYDCKDIWVKKTKGGGETPLINICCNLLVGSTFSHMNVLFPPSRILGGFASRIIYVANKETKGRKIEWEPQSRSPETEALLLKDMSRIFSLSGQFTVTREFAGAFVTFFNECDGRRRSLEDERMQAFLARRHTNILKLSMLCSVSESDSLTLDIRHWERALSLLPEMDTSLDLVMDSASDPQTQLGINHAVVSFLRRSGGRISRILLLRYMSTIGVSRDNVISTLQQLMEASVIGTSGTDYILLTDSDNNLKIVNDVLDVDEEAGLR